MASQNASQVPAQRQADPLSTLKGFLEARASNLAEVLPSSVSPDRVIRVALAAASRNPRLLLSTPQSVYLALHRAAQLGLEAGGPLGEAHLVPFKNGELSKKAGRDVYECELQIGYRGMVTLARRSGTITGIEARVVYASDEFQIRFGTPRSSLRHVPDIRRTGGEVLGAYCVVHLRGSEHPQITWMNLADLHQVRDRSSAYKFDRSSPWHTSFGEMATKTVIKRALKLVPMSSEDLLAKAIAFDGREEPEDLVPGADGVYAPPAEAELGEGEAAALPPRRTTEALTQRVKRQRAAAAKEEPEDAQLALVPQEKADEEPPPPSDDDAPPAEELRELDPDGDAFAAEEQTAKNLVEQIRRATNVQELVQVQAAAMNLGEPFRSQIGEAAKKRIAELGRGGGARRR